MAFACVGQLSLHTGKQEALDTNSNQASGAEPSFGVWWQCAMFSAC